MAQLKQLIHELAEDDRKWEEWDQKKKLYNIEVSLGMPPTSPLHQPEVLEPPVTVSVPATPAAAAPAPVNLKSGPERKRKTAQPRKVSQVPSRGHILKLAQGASKSPKGINLASLH